MGPLYKWIGFYTDEVKDFLDRLADVEDEQGNHNKYLLYNVCSISHYQTPNRENTTKNKPDTILTDQILIVCRSSPSREFGRYRQLNKSPLKPIAATTTL